MFGVFNHKVYNPKNVIVRVFDDEFLAPHSRYTEIRKRSEKIEAGNTAESKEAGIFLVASRDLKKIFITGHFEYDSHIERRI